MTKENPIMDKNAIERTLDRIAHEIIEKHQKSEDVALIGIKTRGVPLAKMIFDKIKKFGGPNIFLGELDITLYRDDLSQVAEQPVIHATNIDFNIDGKTILLVDDVLYTGRTIRAAMDAIIDYGRPAKIELVTLIDRGHRELPIRADYVGKNVPTSKDEIVHVMLEETDGSGKVVISKGNKHE
jgi:pyrimidine operon attenuation protein / uracil phosphoribosyltransferase